MALNGSFYVLKNSTMHYSFIENIKVEKIKSDLKKIAPNNYFLHIFSSKRAHTSQMLNRFCQTLETF